MPPTKSTPPSYESLLNEVDKLGEVNRLRLLHDLSKKVKLSKESWQSLSPFLIPEGVRQKLLEYPWSLADRRNLGLLINVPICLQDPSFIRNKSELSIEMIEVGWEPGLTEGPTSARIAVEDYYGENKRPPAKWDKKRHCFVDQQGQPIAPKLNNDYFHQINVWAIAQRILDFYEDYTVLGRPVPWGNGNRLIIKPHAGTGKKGTYYSRATKSLEFTIININVFTCLSHDIVAHETGHAVLDGIRPYFYDSFVPQTVAFHEFVADLTAIMSALRNNYVRKIFIAYLEKGLPEKDFLAKIGEEFAKAISNSDFIRTAKNKITMDNVRQWEKERPDDAAHDSSQVLTGLIYDLLLKLYQCYRQRGHTPDNASWHATRRLTQMALQPLDLLPSIDVTFSDYVEAFLIRDELLDPEDEHGYRPLIRQLCDERKIPAPSEGTRPKRPKHLTNPHVDSLLASRTSAYKYIHSNREALHIPPKRDLIVDVYAAQKVDRAFVRLPEEIIVQYIWQEDVPLKGKEFGALEGKTMPLFCGGTLVFDDNANFRYWVNKPGTEFQLIQESEQKKKNRVASGDQDTCEEEQKIGESRKQELLNYIAVCAAKGDKDAIEDLLRLVS